MPVSAHQRRAPHQRPVLRLFRVVEAAELRLLAAQAEVVEHRAQASNASFGRGREVANQPPAFARRGKIEDVIDARGDQDDAGDAMDDSAQLFAHAQHMRKPGVGELERESRNDQNDEAQSRIRCCQR